MQSPWLALAGIFFAQLTHLGLSRRRQQRQWSSLHRTTLRENQEPSVAHRFVIAAIGASAEAKSFRRSQAWSQRLHIFDFGTFSFQCSNILHVGAPRCLLHGVRTHAGQTLQYLVWRQGYLHNGPGLSGALQGRNRRPYSVTLTTQKHDVL